MNRIRSLAHAATAVFGAVLSACLCVLGIEAACAFPALSTRAASLLDCFERTAHQGELAAGMFRSSAEHDLRRVDLLAEQTNRRMVQLRAVLNNANTAVKNIADLAADMNGRTERLTRASEALLSDSATAPREASIQVQTNGRELHQALADAHTAAENLHRLASGPALTEAASNTAKSSANIERMTAAAADSAESIRDMLSPTKKSFWRRLLELMIPRPTVRVGR